MEYAQRADIYKSVFTKVSTVLILILMEYAQRAGMLMQLMKWTRVLILILMEYAQRVIISFRLLANVGLNPYSNGICSKRLLLFLRITLVLVVLILILMEYAQRA